MKISKPVYIVALIILVMFTAAFIKREQPSRVSSYQPSVASLWDTLSPLQVEGPVFEKVEEEASFPGGAPAWAMFLQKNLKADVPVNKKAPVGDYTVYIQFVVDKEGKLSDFKALTNHGYGMEKEVLRVIKKSPDWKPAKQNGRTVKAFRKQPITFRVEKG